MSNCLLLKGCIWKGCCCCRHSTSPHFCWLKAQKLYYAYFLCWSTYTHQLLEKQYSGWLKKEATPLHMFTPCTTPLGYSILTAQWPTCFTGQMLNGSMFFLKPSLPTTLIGHWTAAFKRQKCTNLNPVYVVFWFSRWISYSSNRKLSLLKVKNVNVHWLLRKYMIYAASSV